MRLPEDGEDLIGKVCVCSRGRLGIVTGRELLMLEDEETMKNTWVGLDLWRDEVWFSRKPCVLWDDPEDYRKALTTVG